MLEDARLLLLREELVGQRQVQGERVVVVETHNDLQSETVATNEALEATPDQACESALLHERNTDHLLQQQVFLLEQLFSLGLNWCCRLEIRNARRLN